MSEIEEVAKSVQKTTELGTKILDSGDKLMSFFAQVFKAPIQEMAGMLTDRLQTYRWKQLVKMNDEIREIHRSRGLDTNNTIPVPPKFALPLLEHASLEEDLDLQKLWACLLANAMDPQFTGELRTCFIEIIKGLSGTDASFLKVFYKTLNREGLIRPLENVSQFFLKKEQLLTLTGLSDTDYQVSAHNLMRVQCIAPAVLKTAGIQFGEESATIFKGLDAITLTPLGVRFIEACAEDLNN